MFSFAELAVVTETCDALQTNRNTRVAHTVGNMFNVGISEDLRGCRDSFENFRKTFMLAHALVVRVNVCVCPPLRIRSHWIKD